MSSAEPHRVERRPPGRLRVARDQGDDRHGLGGRHDQQPPEDDPPGDHRGHEAAHDEPRRPGGRTRGAPRGHRAGPGPLAVGDGRQQPERGRDRRGGRGALHAAARGQHDDGRRHRGQQRPDREDGEAGQDRPPVADPVAEPRAEHQQAAEEHGVPGRDQRAVAPRPPTSASISGSAVTTTVTPRTSTNWTRHSAATTLPTRELAGALGGGGLTARHLAGHHRQSAARRGRGTQRHGLRRPGGLDAGEGVQPPPARQFPLQPGRRRDRHAPGLDRVRDAQPPRGPAHQGAHVGRDHAVVGEAGRLGADLVAGALEQQPEPARRT